MGARLCASTSPLSSHTFVGHRIDLASGIDEHDGYVRFAWTMSAPDGIHVMEGVEFGQLDADVRLQLICGFFGPWPELRRS
jgi:hypothetical protein